MKKRVIITDYLHPYLAEQLVKMDFDVHIREDISNEELYNIISDYDGLVLSTKILVTSKLIDKAVRLKFIARAGSGLDTIDTAYAKSKQIEVLSAPEANANAVAEHALGMLLALLNNLTKADREVREGKWKREENRGYELDGKTIGIIGYGNNGSAFAKKLRGFDVRILAYDKYKSGFGDEHVEEVQLSAIQASAEIISFHVPLTTETTFYFNTDFVNQFKSPIWLMNTSRGKIVNTADLLTALNQGRVLGAALDVLENENLNALSPDQKHHFEQLIISPNTILSPHIAGWSFESYFRISKILAEKIRSLKI